MRVLPLGGHFGDFRGREQHLRGAPSQNTGYVGYRIAIHLPLAGQMACIYLRGLPVAADYPWILGDLRQRIPANLVIAPTILLTQAASKLFVGSAVRLSIKQSMAVFAPDDEMTAFTSDTGAVLTDEHDKILYVEDTL